MGRGLSPLQRKILDVARTARATRHLTWPEAPDAYFFELLRDVFGFRASTLGGAAAHHFDPDEIGRERYLAAKASLSRAVRRLEERGLVRVVYGCSWAGIFLVSDPQPRGCVPGSP